MTGTFRLCVLLAFAFTAAAAEPDGGNPVVRFETSQGAFTVELFTSEAPLSAANFLEYVNSGFYDGTIFHRVVPGFVIQGGGFTADMTEKETRAPVKNEANNGLANVRGTLAMARRQDPDSASSQFFINLADNAFLDHQAPTMTGWGYAVFGRVIAGMDVIDAIAQSPTGVAGGMPDVPVTPVVVESARVTTPAP
jgi:cyclophilin family peptidyl-prolyl cis-trans isomerase